MMSTAAQPDMACRWCGLIHGAQCPSVKAIEYFANGMVKRVEFKMAGDYPPVITGLPQHSPSVAPTWPWQYPQAPVTTCGGAASQPLGN
jgi:hypothetical protein